MTEPQAHVWPDEDAHPINESREHLTAARLRASSDAAQGRASFMAQQVTITRVEVVYEWMALPVYRQFLRDKAAREGKKAPDDKAVVGDFMMMVREARPGFIKRGPPVELAVEVGGHLWAFNTSEQRAQQLEQQGLVLLPHNPRGHGPFSPSSAPN